MKEKLLFLQTELIQHLRALDTEAIPAFGKMNARQMVEHLSNSVKIASGKTPVEQHNSDDDCAKSYVFMMSDKPFKPNTSNALLPENPKASRFKYLGNAIDDLEDELENFVNVYTENPSLKVQNPFFGKLNFEEQVQLLLKHAKHHLAQFGIA